MSNEAHKADQIAYRYYTKLALVVHAARATAEANPQAKVDKWVRIIRPYRPLALLPDSCPLSSILKLLTSSKFSKRL